MATTSIAHLYAYTPTQLSLFSLNIFDRIFFFNIYLDHFGQLGSDSDTGRSELEGERETNACKEDNWWTAENRLCLVIP